MQAEHGAHLACAAQPELAQTAPLLLLRRRLRLDPAKHRLDAAAGVDRPGVALVAGGAPIDGGTTGRLVFTATCGVTAMRRISATKRLVSSFLSAPIVF